MTKLHLVKPTADQDMTKEGLLLYKLIEELAERIAEIEIDLLYMQADIADKE